MVPLFWPNFTSPRRVCVHAVAMLSDQARRTGLHSNCYSATTFSGQAYTRDRPGNIIVNNTTKINKNVRRDAEISQGVLKSNSATDSPYGHWNRIPDIGSGNTESSSSPEPCSVNLNVFCCIFIINIKSYMKYRKRKRLRSTDKINPLTVPK